MNAPEAAKLLAILSAIDRREFDAATAQGWAWALEDVPYERAVEAARRALRAGDGYVDQQAIRKQLRAMQPALERDVRSAKARGLVPADWNPRTPLSIELEQQLRAIQSTDWADTNSPAAEIESPSATPEQIRAAIGRTVTVKGVPR